MSARDLMVHAATMTSREMADLTEKRHDSVKRTIDTLLAKGLIGAPQIVGYLDPLNRAADEYLVTKRDSYVVVAQLSPEFMARVIDRWQALEAMQAAPVRALSSAEMFLQSAQTLVGIEQEQVKQAASILSIGVRVEQIAETQLLTTCPSNAENITTIRVRINKKHGLSANIIDQVMRQSLYAPKPCGMVKNTREEAQGATYTVYWIKDVTALFSRFTAECAPTTATQYTHPLIVGKFKLTGATS